MPCGLNAFIQLELSYILSLSKANLSHIVCLYPLALSFFSILIFIQPNFPHKGYFPFSSLLFCEEQESRPKGLVSNLNERSLPVPSGLNQVTIVPPPFYSLHQLCTWFRHCLFQRICFFLFYFPSFFSLFFLCGFCSLYVFFFAFCFDEHR